MIIRGGGGGGGRENFKYCSLGVVPFEEVIGKRTYKNGLVVGIEGRVKYMNITIEETVMKPVLL